MKAREYGVAVAAFVVSGLAGVGIGAIAHALWSAVS